MFKLIRSIVLFFLGLPLLANSQIIATIAGTGAAGYGGDGGPSGTARLYLPVGVAVDGVGNLFVADFRNNAIRLINKFGVITTIAGNGAPGYSGDNRPATSAKLNTPRSVAVDASGNVFIADYANSVVRKVNSSGIIITVAGNGMYGFSGDGAAATDAMLNYPTGIAIDGSGNLFIADFINNRIRMVNSAGIISTIAGNGTAAFSGDLGPATSAALNYPMGVAADGPGNIYIADYLNSCVRKVDVAGIITTVAGNGTAGYMGDGGAATAAELNYPENVVTDKAGNLLIADVENNVIRRVNSLGIISTVAGNGMAGFGGDGGPATAAELDNPSCVAIDTSGNLFIADFANNRIREVASPAVIGALSISPITSDNPIVIFPNPASTVFSIEYNPGTVTHGAVSLKAINILGEVVYERIIYASHGEISIQISTGDFSNGIYLLELTSPQERVLSRLVIKK